MRVDRACVCACVRASACVQGKSAIALAHMLNSSALFFLACVT